MKRVGTSALGLRMCYLKLKTEFVTAKAITKELSGIPLAPEQCGALIRSGEFTSAQFLATYREEYKRLMSTRSDEEVSSYDKNRIIMTVLEMAYRSVGSDPDHAALLIFIGILGSWQIPISLVERFEFFEPGLDNSGPAASDDLKNLLQVFQKPHFLRLALRRLASFCLIRLKGKDGHITSFSIHRILCRWSLEKATTLQKQDDYIVQAAFGLAKQICKLDLELPVLGGSLVRGMGNQVIERNYLAGFRYCLSLIPDHVSRSHLDPERGRMRAPYAIILRQAA